MSKKQISDKVFLGLLQDITEDKPLIFSHSSPESAKKFIDNFYRVRKQYRNKPTCSALTVLAATQRKNTVVIRIDTTQSLMEEE